MQPGPLKKRQREFDDANPSKTQKISIQVSSWDDLLKITADAEVPEDWETFVGELKKGFPDGTEKFFIPKFKINFLIKIKFLSF